MPGSNSYLFPYGQGRSFPYHGYTPTSIAWKRYAENTSGLALTVGCILPALNQVNARLERHVNAGTDVSMDELLDLLSESGLTALTTYIDRMARIASQTGLICLLINTKNPFCDSMVYLWDLYPRLHHRYIGGILDALRLPRFLVSLIGPQPTVSDVTFLQSKVSPLATFEDCSKRYAIVFFGDAIVDTVRLLMDKKSKRRAEAIVKQLAQRLATSVFCAGCAAVGRGLSGERGEYWGELTGQLLSPLAVSQVCMAVIRLRHKRMPDPLGEPLQRTRSHRSTSAAPVPPVVRTRTA